MATITEDYVSFETAKLLKERGFDELGDYYYTKNGEFTDCLTIDYVNGCDRVICKNHTLFPYKAPTLQMAMKWLREVHKLEIIPFHEMFQGNSWWYRIERNTSLSLITEYEEDSIYGSYEKAAEAAIKYCLEHLI